MGKTGKPPSQHVWYNHLVEMRFVNSRIRGMSMSRIDLLTENEVGLRLSLNRDVRGLSFDPGVNVYGAMIFDLVNSLEAACPRLTISIGEGKFWTGVWFMVGLLTVLVSGGILFLAKMDNVPLDRMILAGPVMLLLGLFGGAIMLSNHPWKQRPTMSFSEFRTFLLNRPIR